jgi:formylglycine-generating enzyme required for sulfatase activity
VTQYEGKGDSPFGVVDMSGNVWEWCLTDYDNGSQDISRTSERRVLRGGSWGNLSTFRLRADFRFRNSPDDWSNSRGFRLALS